ncbi:MAG: hypothetical protein GC147_01830 [Porphyrobacter sp.]|nr:hypothetical protein [Porphyrobacter sp.]
MPKIINLLTLAGAAAGFALVPSLAAAQQESPTSPAQPMAQPMQDNRPMQQDGQAMAEPTPDQQAAMDAWPQDRKSAYQLWPRDTQDYYWTLTPQRQELFWRLKDEDKLTLSTMPDPQAESVWTQLETRNPLQPPAQQPQQ